MSQIRRDFAKQAKWVKLIALGRNKVSKTLLSKFRDEIFFATNLKRKAAKIYDAYSHDRGSEVVLKRFIIL